MTPAGSSVRLVDVVRDLAAARGMAPERAGVRVAAAFRAWPTEPTPEEAWVVDEFGVPLRTIRADLQVTKATPIDPKTGKPQQREIELRVRLEDLALAAEPWRGDVFLDCPDDIAYWETRCVPTRFHVAPAFMAAVLKKARIPAPASLAEAVAVTAPVVVRLVDLAPRWAAETGGTLAEIAADLSRWFFTPTPEWAAALAADADHCEARAAEAKTLVAAGQVEAWKAEAEARIAARARAAATEAAAEAGRPAPADPTLDEAWVAAIRLRPLLKASQYRVRRTDLSKYFEHVAGAARRGAPPSRLGLGAGEPDAWYTDDFVWLSAAWLRREFDERLGTLPAFLGTPDVEPPPLTDAPRAGVPAPAGLAEAVAVTEPAEFPPAVEAATPVPAPAPVPIVTVHDERIPLLIAAIKERGWPPLAIPRRGVAALRQALYDERGWTADMFRGTWE